MLLKVRKLTYFAKDFFNVHAGYWMPFQCARAVCETFAYSIRYALVPIFGTDFLGACLRPEHPGFGSFKIDPLIVAHCGTETKLWPLREDARATPASSRAPSEAPETPRSGRNILQSRQFKELRPKLTNKAMSPESGYGTDTDGANSSYSPAVSPAPSTWASINRPETPVSMPPTQLPTPATAVIPTNGGGATSVKSYTPSELESANALLQLRRKEVLHHGLVPPLSTVTSFPPNPPISRSTTARTDNNTPQAKRRLSDLDVGYVADRSSTASEIGDVSPTQGSTRTATAANEKGLIFGDVTNGLIRGAMGPLKRGVGEDFEAAHREKRPRFMSV